MRMPPRRWPWRPIAGPLKGARLSVSSQHPPRHGRWLSAGRAARATRRWSCPSYGISFQGVSDGVAAAARLTTWNTHVQDGLLQIPQPSHQCVGEHPLMAERSSSKRILWLSGDAAAMVASSLPLWAIRRSRIGTQGLRQCSWCRLRLPFPPTWRGRPRRLASLASMGSRSGGPAPGRAGSSVSSSDQLTAHRCEPLPVFLRLRCAAIARSRLTKSASRMARKASTVGLASASGLMASSPCCMRGVRRRSGCRGPPPPSR